MTKKECDALLNVWILTSENLLKRNKEFYPIGAVLKNDGKIAFTAVESDKDFPASESVIEDLTLAHKQMAQKHEIKASGIAWDAIFTSDEKQFRAIVVSIEHKDNYSVTVGLPYKFGWFKKMKFGELFTQSGKHDIF